MDEPTHKDPLHGMTLQAVVEDLVARHGWPELAELVPLRCFSYKPTVTSSLRFLRRTDWARSKVERLYLQDQHRIQRNAKRNRRRAAMRAQRVEEDAGGREDPGPSQDETAGA